MITDNDIEQFIKDNESHRLRLNYERYCGTDCSPFELCSLDEDGVEMDVIRGELQWETDDQGTFGDEGTFAVMDYYNNYWDEVWSYDSLVSSTGGLRERSCE